MSFPIQPADDSVILGPDGNRSVYRIPERNFPKFEEQIEALSKRSLKLGFPAIKPIAFSHEQVTNSAGIPVTDRNGRPEYVIEVYLTAEMPRINGWTFVARLDHANEVGNIIRTIPNTGELPSKFRNTAPDCDHCKINRKRRDTFVVRNDETSEHKQIGSSCLKDFFGHDPYKIAKLAELLGYADEVGHAASQGEFVMRDKRWIDTVEFVTYTAAAIRQFGWVPGSAARSSRGELRATRATATSLMFPADSQHWEEDEWDAYRARTITPQDEAVAAESLAWVQSLSDKDDINEYLHNLTVVASAPVMESRSTGLAASIPAAYSRNKRDAEYAANRAEMIASRAAAKAAEELARASIQTEVGDFRAVISLMRGDAQDSKIRFPKIRLQLENGTPVILAIAGAGARQPGTINLSNGGEFGTPENVWFGRVTPEGRYEPNSKTDWSTKQPQVSVQTATSVAALLSLLATDPVGVAARYGKLTGQCCMCSKALTDARSAHVGYGKKCAQNVGWYYPTAADMKKIAMGVAA